MHTDRKNPALATRGSRNCARLAACGKRICKLQAPRYQGVPRERSFGGCIRLGPAHCLNFFASSLPARILLNVSSAIHVWTLRSSRRLAPM